jgi:hypothetical protein
VRRLQYSFAIYAERSKTSASGVGRSNVAPCTLITRLQFCAGFGSRLATSESWFFVPRGRVWVGWQPGFSDVPGPESPAVSSRCRHLHAGRMVVMAGLTLSLNLHAHICMCKSGRDPGYTRPLTLCWRVVCVQLVAPFCR